MIRKILLTQEIAPLYLIILPVVDSITLSFWNANSTAKDNCNSSEPSAIEKKVENGNFIQIDNSNVSSYIQASIFSRENDLLDLTISEVKIEWVNEIHREARGDLTIITTKKNLRLFPFSVKYLINNNLLFNN